MGSPMPRASAVLQHHEIARLCMVAPFPTAPHMILLVGDSDSLFVADSVVELPRAATSTALLAKAAQSRGINLGFTMCRNGARAGKRQKELTTSQIQPFASVALAVISMRQLLAASAVQRDWHSSCCLLRH